MKIGKQMHYGSEVFVNKDTDKLRRTECLCLNCNTLSNCTISSRMLEMCKDYDLALMMTRCKFFENK